MNSIFQPTTANPYLIYKLTHYGFLFEKAVHNIQEIGQYERQGSIGVLCLKGQKIYLYTRNLTTDKCEYKHLPYETVEQLTMISNEIDYEEAVRNILSDFHESSLLVRPTIKCIEEQALRDSPRTVTRGSYN